MLAIVVVCYHSAGALPDCLTALGAPNLAPGRELILVNNSQDDAAEIAEIAGKFGATLVQSPRNLGYGGGCNAGARAAGLSRYTIFVNPDVHATPEDLQAMIDIAEADSSIVALGPLQSGKNGKVRGKRRSVGQGKLFGPPLRQSDATGALVETGFLSGGALMTRSDLFARIGGFDERIFLFHEDDDLCLRLAKHGRLVYATGVVVQHDHGTSTPRTDALTHLRSFHLGFSRIYVLRKHFGQWAALGALAHALVKFVSPQILTQHGRIKAQAFLAGTKNAFLPA